jgi:glycerol-3-phosphate dehydrogenase
MVPGGGLTGAAVWYDAVMEDSERVVIEALHAACDHGARALNYVEATELRVEHGEVSGVRGLDRRTGRDHAFRAPVVINAAGPWARRLGASFDRDLPALWRPTLAFNLALRADAPLPGALAVAPRPPGRPTYFLHPWKGGILAGTHHSPAPEDPNAGPEPEVVDELREAMARAAPGLELLRAEVARVYWGLLPGRPGKRLGLATRPVVVEHGRRGGPRGLVSVSGVKFTTARAVAESVLRRIWGRDLRPAVPVNGRDALDVERARARLTADGWDAPASRRLLEDLVARESVVTREDLVERRLGWGPFRDPPEALEVPGLGGRGEEDLTEAPVRP